MNRLETLQTHFPAPSVRHTEQKFTMRHHSKRVEDLCLLPAPSLSDEVLRIRARGEEGLYLLPDTGFQVKTQIDLLLENHTKGIPLSDTFQQLDQDIQGFKIEYLVEQPVFPIVLEKKNYQGKQRLVGKLYGGKPLVDVTSGKERDGIVKASVQRIENFLLVGAPGSMAVMTSPKGWSGYVGIEYPDSQTYCFQVQADGQIRGFTLKTDMTLAQNKALLERLGVEKKAFEKEADVKSGIKDVVNSVVFIDPKEKKSIEDIVQLIKHIKGGDVSYRDSTGAQRTFNEMEELLRYPEALWMLDDTTKRLSDGLKEYISYRITSPDDKTRRDLEVAIGLVVMRLMHEVRPRKQIREMKINKAYSTIIERIPHAIFDPRKTLEDMQKIGGCAGGGNKQSNILNSITPRLTNLLNQDSEWFTCPKCSYKADGPIGNVCPGCNLTKEQFAAEEGAVVCD